MQLHIPARQPSRYSGMRFQILKLCDDVFFCQQESGRLQIDIRDQGTGIPPDAVESIYDPFFTTKQTGTGLGLPIAYQVIEQHGGELTLAENSETGACFSIWIPLGNTTE